MLAPLNIAHAACKGHAPENTLAGIRAALALGVDAIEIDVHLTVDGVPVLIHDTTVDRTTNGAGAISGITLADARTLDAGGDLFDGRFRGEPIPTLDEVLDLTRTACLLVIEIKPRGIEQAVIDAVRRHDAAGSAMIWSFATEAVGAARTLAPEIPAALSFGRQGEAVAAMLDRAVRLGAQAVTMEHGSVDAGFVRAARLRGLNVYAWTPDQPEQQARVAALGVAGIVTNVPDDLRATLVSEGYEGADTPEAASSRRPAAARSARDTLAERSNPAAP